MVMKKGGKLIAAVLAVFSFVTMAWLSCTKVSSNLYTCNNVICENGGYCHKDTVTKTVGCLCPSGYEGNNCAIVSAGKYIGAWDVTQIITGSDSVGYKGDTVHYVLFLKQSPTPTTFLIYNFNNNPYYNNIICTMDSVNTYNFTVDTLSSYHLNYDHYHIVVGAGSITKNDSLITANMITRHLSPTTNWINDTMIIWMTQHHY